LEKSRRGPEARIALGQTHSTALRSAQGDNGGRARAYMGGSLKAEWSGALGMVKTMRAIE